MLKYLPWSQIRLDTVPKVDGLKADVMTTVAVIIGLSFILGMAIIFMIQNQPGANPKDRGQRKRVFWLLGLILPAVVLVIYIWLNAGLIDPRKAFLKPSYFILHATAICEFLNS